MTKEEVFNIIRDVLVDHLDVDPKTVTLESSFRRDLGADSLDSYEIFYDITDKCGCEIPDDKLQAIETVNDAVELVISIKNSEG